jgi:hypothetical protein
MEHFADLAEKFAAALAPNHLSLMVVGMPPGSAHPMASPISKPNASRTATERPA